MTMMACAACGVECSKEDMFHSGKGMVCPQCHSEEDLASGEARSLFSADNIALGALVFVCGAFSLEINGVDYLGFVLVLVALIAAAVFWSRERHLGGSLLSRSWRAGLLLLVAAARAVGLLDDVLRLLA